jgi:hypothetical protein
MPVKVKVRNQRQIVVPLRFARAVGGAPQIDAPEVDDRGFIPGARPVTWGHSDYRGAMVGVTKGDTVRIKVLREDIDSGAPLAVTSSDTSIVSVEDPPSGGTLAADGIFKIKALQDLVNRPVKIQVRLGDATSPILGELEPHIFELKTLRVRVHLVGINGVATARTAASMVAVFEDINRIWRPAGIEFEYDPALTRPETINGLAVAGQMTTNLRGNDWAEFTRIINLHPDPNRINIYCVVVTNEAFGMTFANNITRSNGGYGIVLGDDSSSNSNAHELCHYLDNPEHAHEDAARTVNIRKDIWVRRRLMWTPNPFPVTNPAFRNDIGYGAQTRGAQISIKDLAGDPWDGEQNRARVRSRNPY